MRANVKLPKFETLVALYQKDPAAYEEFRRRMLNDEVNAAPPEHQAALRNTLCIIEIAREKTKSPLEAAIVAYLMMIESTSQLRKEIIKFHHLTAGMQASVVIERVRNQSKNIPRLD